MRGRRVVVTGLGAVTPLGVGVPAFWQGLLSGRSGVRRLRDSALRAGLPVEIAAQVPHGDASTEWNAKRCVFPEHTRSTALFTQYAVCAATQAMQDAGLDGRMSDTDKLHAGVCIGSGIGSLQDTYETALVFHEQGPRRVSPMFVPKILANMAAGHVSMLYGLRGPNHAASTACATGAHAIGDAARFISYGDADVMLAGGTESPLHPLAVAGFAKARSLAVDWNTDPERASRPFDRDRAGFVLGEGAGVVVLEELEHARRRGAHMYAEVRGYGLSGDAYHMTAPRVDGSGAHLAMSRALSRAGVAARQLDYINAHATSTQLGDAAECAAIEALMQAATLPASLAVSSIKGAIGHLLGAAGAVEAIATILAVKHDAVPPTLNLHHPGDGAREYHGNFVPREAQQRRVGIALTNSFGFGGTNASLVFAKVE